MTRIIIIIIMIMIQVVAPTILSPWLMMIMITPRPSGPATVTPSQPDSEPEPGSGGCAGDSGGEAQPESHKFHC